METFDDFDIDNWIKYIYYGSTTIVDGVGEAGGKVLECYKCTWLIYKHNIPYDPTKLYRFRVRVRQTVDPTDPSKNRFYAGFEGVAADGVTLVNVVGQSSHSSQHYFVAHYQPLTVAAGWKVYTGWCKGQGTHISNAWNPLNPSGMHPDVRYVRPLFCLNYNQGDGTAQIDSIAIDVLDEDAAFRTYTAIGSDGLVHDTGIADGAITPPKIPDATIAAAKLTQSAQDLVLNPVDPFYSNAYNMIGWNAFTMKFVSGTTQAISAGSITGLTSAWTYIYWTSGSTLLSSTSLPPANAILICVARCASTVDALGSVYFIKVTGPAKIDGDQVLAKTITAGHISVNDLSALSADMGSLTSGFIRLPATGNARIEIDGDSATKEIRTFNASSVQTTSIKSDGSGFLGVGATQIAWNTAGSVTIPGTALNEDSIAASRLMSTAQDVVINPVDPFSSTSYNAISWSAFTIKFRDGGTMAINAGSVTNLTTSWTYLYWSGGATLSSSTSIPGANCILIAVAKQSSNSSSGSCTYFVTVTGPARVDGDAIVAKTITAGKINVTQLSALTVDAGTLTAGTLTGVTVQTASSGARVEMTSANGLRTFDSSGNVLVQLPTTGGNTGQIVLTVGGSAATTGKILFGNRAAIHSTAYGTYVGDIGIMPLLAGNGYVYIGNYDTPWFYVGLTCESQFSVMTQRSGTLGLVRGYLSTEANSASNYGKFQALAEGAGGSSALTIYSSGSSSYIIMYSPGTITIEPYSANSGTLYLGDSSYFWNYIYLYANYSINAISKGIVTIRPNTSGNGTTLYLGSNSYKWDYIEINAYSSCGMGAKYSSSRYAGFYASSSGVDSTIFSYYNATYRANIVAHAESTFSSITFSSNRIGFFGASAAAKQTVSGSKGGNAALGSLITALASYGLITDSTT